MCLQVEVPSRVFEHVPEAVTCTPEGAMSDLA